MNIDEMKILAVEAVKTTIGEGAETAEVTVSGQDRFSVTVRNEKTDNLTESVSSRISITLSIGKKKSSITTSDLSAENIRKMIREAVELSSVMDRDEYFDLPDPEETGVAGEINGLFDNDATGIPADEKISTALALEKAASGLDKRIISDGASFSSGIYSLVFANSLGFCEGYSQTWFSTDVSCAVEDTGRNDKNTARKQSSFWFSTSCDRAGLDDIENTARIAVKRTLRKLGAVKPETCSVPVIFDQVTARKFLGCIAAAVNGGNIYKRASFLADMLGREISSPLVTIIDDPLMPGRLGSRPFDAEGVKSRKNMVVENGILRTYLLSSYQGRKLSMKTTGSSGGISNFYMVPGSNSLDEIISSIDEGLFLTALSGPGANWSSGDFSQGAQGIWISKGKLTHPVTEFTIAGTFADMLSKISMVEDRLEWKSTVACPSFKIDQMTISGS
jgi:PmbA protein